MTRPRLAACFDALGQARCQQLRLVSADAAPWIATVVAERCPQARLCLDPFHVAQWATDALDGEGHIREPSEEAMAHLAPVPPTRGQGRGRWPMAPPVWRAR